jgi:hypothetical protein
MLGLLPSSAAAPSYFNFTNAPNQESVKTMSYAFIFVEVPDRLKFQLQTQSHPGNYPL